MSNPVDEKPILFSGFQGLEQRQDKCDNSHFIDSLNVECINGEVRRRPGRQKIFNTATVIPSMVLYYDGTKYIDVTTACTDGNTSTAAITSAWATGNEKLLVGLPFPYAGVNFTLSSFASTNNTVYANYHGATGSTGDADIQFSPITDTTLVGGYSMKQNGTISWSYSYCTLIGANRWAPGRYTGNFPSPTNPHLYWTIFASLAMTGCNIADITCTLGTSLPLLGESRGAIEFNARDGSRYLVSSEEFPGRMTDTTTYYYNPINRVVYFDLGRAARVPIQVPADMTIGDQDLSGIASYAVFNGWLIGTTSSGSLWRFDGTTCARLESMAGMDFQNGVVGAQGYLGFTPRGRCLEVYRNRLMVTRDPSDPLKFYASIEDNNTFQIPANAPVGGPNVWPLRYVFRVPGRAGDSIQGAAVINDRYVILTRNQVWIFDDTAIRALNSDIGCIAPGSIQKIDNSIFFLSDTGVFATDGNDVVELSQSIQDTLSTINWQGVLDCVSAHDPVKKEYWLWVPINGERGNQIAIVYNYRSKTWRIVSGWYPWDTVSRRDANSVVQRVTAACIATGTGSIKRLITFDANGNIWQENTGLDDDGSVYPAYAVLPQVSVGEQYAAYREWYINADSDGQYLEGYSLGEGDRFDQEIDRKFASVATLSECIAKQLTTNNAVASQTQQTWGSLVSWPALNFAKTKKYKFSFGRNLSRMNPVLHWAPGTFSGPAFTSQVPAKCAIAEVQIGVTPNKSGR
jgi:hypothetical protein